MIDPARSGHGVSAVATLISSGGTRQPLQTQAFASAFSGELDRQDRAGELTQASRANLRPSQGIITGQDPGAGTSTSASPPEQNPFEALISAYDGGIAAAGASAGSAPAATANTQTLSSFDEAYWASQPAAVQQLQTVNPADRTELAAQLANQGYSIDVPIMVWGWDPATTMAARQADGYTWVPSALQQPVEVAPGLTFNGQSYNPNNPPAGSIAVT